jgi:hypothetical protein
MVRRVDSSFVGWLVGWFVGWFAGGVVGWFVGSGRECRRMVCRTVESDFTFLKMTSGKHSAPPTYRPTDRPTDLPD